MKHNISELYKITYNNKTIRCTLEFINANDLEMYNHKKQYDNKPRLLAKPCRYHACDYKRNNGGIKVYDTNEIITVWLYGEHTWFDTMEERDAYRESMKR